MGSCTVIAVGWGWDSVRGISRLRPNWVLIMDGCQRIDERPYGMFYRGPTVGAKFSYQNPESWHIKVNMVKWGPELHTSARRGSFDKKGDLQNKGLWRSSKNMNEESKAVWTRKREGGAQACCLCVECAIDHSCKEVWWNLYLWWGTFSKTTVDRVIGM